MTTVRYPTVTLYPFQEEGVARATTTDNFFFANYDTGSGKTIFASVSMDQLFNTQQIDLAIVFTLRVNKINFTRKINEITNLTAMNIEGTRTHRTKKYKEGKFDVLVMNYEKANFDFNELVSLAKGKRVVFILDEVQKVLLPNNAFRALRKLIKSTHNPRIWPLSASTVNDDPLRYWRLFNFIKPNPLGLQKDFKEKYVKETVLVEFNERQRTFVDVWDKEKLKEIPEIVKPYVHVVRKSDPNVRAYFKNSNFIVEPVQLSTPDQELYSIIEEIAREQRATQHYAFSRVELFNALCFICNTAEAFNYSENSLAKFLRAEGFTFSSGTSNKFEQVINKIEEIRSQGDKVVVFTQWTNLSLFPFSRMLDKRNIKHVQHYGTGMTTRAAQQAQDTFKSDPSVTVFLSSDAGSHGLNFQEARYVIHIEGPQSFELLKQRSDRIDRIDSYFDELTTYLFLTEGTVEERIWKVNNWRRQLASNIYGTKETLSRPPIETVDPHSAWLLLGDKE